MIWDKQRIFFLFCRLKRKTIFFSLIIRLCRPCEMNYLKVNNISKNCVPLKDLPSHSSFSWMSKADISANDTHRMYALWLWGWMKMERKGDFTWMIICSKLYTRMKSIQFMGKFRISRKIFNRTCLIFYFNAIETQNLFLLNLQKT